ncbi:hypothetical protein GOBAR_AA29500 [Gossypium barbadense]|uniref:RNase H type-1 domain-containing protein n=1 Tax=Gossypium barbadense TaxID=3634 RepID=A0A2P5WJC5_GOSBA|nr:hypothetical protein GOBAR_AA29500 [Gossypium barbadense]
MEVWALLKLQNILMNPDMDFIQWITWASGQLNTCQNRLFCYGLWAIWGERNKKVHEEKTSTGQEIVNFINNYLFELNGPEKEKSVREEEHKRWTQPPSEFVKINFDGAYDSTHQQSASRVVARNTEGIILHTCSDIHHDVTLAFTAEAIACRKAVQIEVE